MPTVVEKGWSVVERAHMETDSLLKKLSRETNAVVYTPCVSETAASLTSLFDEVDVMDTDPVELKDPIVVDGVHTISGIQTSACECVDALRDQMDFGVCLVFMPSRASAEKATVDFPYSAPRGEPMYYIYQKGTEDKLRRPCFVFGGPEMDAWNSDDVAHVVDAARVYRRVHSMMDWSLAPIGRARWVSRRRRAMVSYRMLMDPAYIEESEFSVYPDAWDALVTASPNIVTAAILYDLLETMKPTVGCLVDAHSRHLPTHASLHKLLRTRGYKGAVSTTQVDWETTKRVLCKILPSYEVLTIDTAVTSDGRLVHADRLGLGMRGVFARCINGRMVGRIPTGKGISVIHKRTIDLGGIPGVAAVRFMGLPGVKIHFNKTSIQACAFDGALIDRVESEVCRLRAASMEHTMVLEVTPTLGMRVGAGMEFRGVSGGEYSIVALYKTFVPQVGRLLVGARGWFVDEGNFVFEDGDEYSRFADAISLNGIRTRSFFTRHAPKGIRRLYDVFVTWYDGSSTGVAVVKGEEVKLDREDWDEEDVAAHLGCDKTDVSVKRVVRRLSRGIPGVVDQTADVARLPGLRCTATLRGVSVARLKTLRDKIPRMDDVTTQPIRAWVTLRLEGDTPVTSRCLWDLSDEDPFTRLDYIHPTTRTSYVVSPPKSRPAKLVPGRCGICYEYREIPVLGICGCRSFCLTCLQDYVNTVLEEFREPVACPTPECRQRLHPADVVAFAHPDALSKYLRTLGGVIATRFRDVLSACPGKCGGITSPKADTFSCDVCETEWCMHCYRNHGLAKPAHRGFCASMADGEWDEIRRQAADAGLVECPACQTPYDKDHNCFHVVCEAPMCKTHFCWGCGVAFSNDPTSSDAEARLVEIRDGVAFVEVDDMTWRASGVPVPKKGAARVDASRMRFVEGRDDAVVYPTYVYEHMTVCPKSKP